MRQKSYRCLFVFIANLLLLGFGLSACGSSDSTPTNQPNVVALAKVTVSPTSNMAQPTLTLGKGPSIDETKIAELNYYYYKGQTAVAGPRSSITPPVWTPMPTITPDLQSGFVMHSCGFPKNQLQAYNCWRGIYNGLAITTGAGAKSNDDNQGLIAVMTTTLNQQFSNTIFYKTPSTHGGVKIATVDGPHQTMYTTDGTRFVFNVLTRIWEDPGACQVYPIALDKNSINPPNLARPFTIDTFNGSGPGNFGWLSWVGDKNESSLVKSLTIPGDSATYINPNAPTSKEMLSVGDWVAARPGKVNSDAVRTALDTLAKTGTVIMPTWDQVSGQGANLQYHISGFVWAAIDNFDLPHGKIAIEYWSGTTC